jgi:hypothetical protein
MDALLFFSTVILLFILIIRLLIKILTQKRIVDTSKYIVITLLSYSIIWIIFYIKSSNQIVPLASDICFDDWCATVTSFEKTEKIGTQIPKGEFYILTIKMTNNARGIAQKPSEPRIHIIDDLGHNWAVSIEGQKAFEHLQGIQIPIDQRLELHQSLQTKLVFDIPKEAVGLKAIIEEGPAFMTTLMLLDNKKIFQIK